MQEQAETEARKRLESQKAETEAKKEAHRKKVEAGLPPEPPLDQGDNITKIRVRLPKGEYIERRFQAHTPLKVRFASTDRYRFCNFYFSGAFRLFNSEGISNRGIQSYF